MFIFLLSGFTLAEVLDPTSTNLPTQQTNKKLAVWRTDIVSRLVLAEAQDPNYANLLILQTNQNYWISELTKFKNKQTSII